MYNQIFSKFNLFNREFKHNEVFILWDAIFANQNSNDKYDLIYLEYICIAMIFHIRKDLLNMDQNDCFTTLFKYPPVNDIMEIIKLEIKKQD